MYIDKWWGRFIGGTDDALLLADYLGDKAGAPVSLKEILDDLHLRAPLAGGLKGDADPYFIAGTQRSLEPHFDLVEDVVTDLAAIVLECVKNGGVELGDLFKSRQGQGRVEITVSGCPEALQLLVNGLEAFIADPAGFVISEFLNEKELAEFVADCREICGELNRR
ncbi:MAG: hypothetical protein LBI59_10420 [Candidatus Accumulibacter sp.]|jgi:hypothetical protein|nr:hypothetical protein [Accumulibacter sp.]